MREKKDEENRKKRKILLSTFIPISLVCVSAAIIIPLLTLCNKKNTDLHVVKLNQYSDVAAD
jgi:type IV secretory pathway component VirB8